VRSCGVGSTPITVHAQSKPHRVHVPAWTLGVAGWVDVGPRHVERGWLLRRTTAMDTQVAGTKAVNGDPTHGTSL